MTRKMPHVHGTFPMAYSCKCEICLPMGKKYHAQTQKNHVARERAKREAGIAVPEHVPHGSVSTYNNYVCRCVACKKAWAEMCQTAKLNRATKPIPEHVHGTENGYGNYRCRCVACSTAWRVGTLARRKRAAERNRPQTD